MYSAYSLFLTSHDQLNEQQDLTGLAVFCYHGFMKIISWNVNGIRAVHRKGLFVPLFEKYQPDVLCLQETKAERHQHDVDLPAYTEYWCSAQKKGYSGTAIFTKERPLTVINGLPEHICKKFNIRSDAYGNPNTEGRVMSAEYENFYIVTVYTPNSKDDLSRIPLRYEVWDPAFLAYVCELQAHKPVIMCGDFNVAHTSDDLAKPKQNVGKKGFTSEERGGVDNILSAGFVDTLRIFTQGNGHYTWWSNFAHSRERNVGWRIDYFFVSQALVPEVQSAEILGEVMGSDHCPILLELR